jgi:hypothetical protein
MKYAPIAALLLAILGWALTAVTTIHLLSGHFDERTCQTACVQAYFFSGVAAGVVSLILGLVGLTRPGGRVLTYLALLLAVPLCAVFAGLFLIGNFA